MILRTYRGRTKSVGRQQMSSRLLLSAVQRMVGIEILSLPTFSPFAFNLIAQGHYDIMKMEDKAEFLKRMHQMVLAKVALKEGKENKA